MNRILMFALLAVFALLISFLSAETPLHLDAVVESTLDVGSDKPLAMESIEVLVMVFHDAELPERDEQLSLGVAVRDLMYLTTNKATAVERGGRDAIRPGGFARLL